MVSTRSTQQLHGPSVTLPAPKPLSHPAPLLQLVIPLSPLLAVAVAVPTPAPWFPASKPPPAPQVSRERRYTPQQEDVGFVLKYECSIIDSVRQFEACRPGAAFTSRVRPAPNLPQRSLVPLPGAGPGGVGGYGRFTLLTYNILADLYAKVGGSASLQAGWGTWL